MLTRTKVTLTESELLEAICKWLNAQDNARCPDYPTLETVDIRVEGFADGVKVVEVRKPEVSLSWSEST